jgi:FkbM family methyltransferase
VPYNSLLGSVLRYPLRWIPSGLIAPILQGRLRGKKWIVGSSTHGCWLGSYEYEKQQLFAQMLSEGKVVFDIGAHVGFYTLLAATLVGSTGRVIAFEPLPRNVQFLRQHLLLNNIHNTTVIERVVSDHTDIVRFQEGPNSSMGFASSTGDLQIPAIDLDHLYRAQLIPAPDLIKMDIEGGEHLALLGAKELLIATHPTIFLATHGTDVHDNCCRLLQSLGYRLRPLKGLDVAQTDELLCVA